MGGQVREEKESISNTQHGQEKPDYAQLHRGQHEKKGVKNRKHLLPDLIGIHSVHSEQGTFFERFQPQTPLERLIIDRELQLARQMLARDETFGHPGDMPLLLDVDERFELH